VRRDGRWEVKMEMEMAGMTLPPQTRFHLLPGHLHGHHEGEVAGQRNDDEVRWQTTGRLHEIGGAAARVELPSLDGE
jgi:hypothetical protein